MGIVLKWNAANCKRGQCDRDNNGNIHNIQYIYSNTLLLRFKWSQIIVLKYKIQRYKCSPKASPDILLNP